jgi:MarR family transcriptional regulator for hemolysin
MGSVEERFADALHNAARVWRQAVDRRLNGLGVSQASWMTITVAAKAKSPLSQSELAERLAVEGATMVSMVDRLVKAGLVRREPSTTDRRVKHVALTEAGERLHGKVRIEAAAVRRELLADVEPKQLLAATELLEKLHAMIEAHH